MKQFLYILLFMFYGTTLLFAQDGKNSLEGKVSFVTSNNVYVKFESTDKIKIGEFIQLNNQNCLQVTEKSSTSVVCSIVNNCEVKVEDNVVYKITVDEKPVIISENSITDSIPTQVIQPKDTDSEEQSLYKENIRGRISMASYNTFSEIREERHRMQGKFSLNADHINDGKFSVETFLAYRNNISVPENYLGRISIFNVYNLNGRFDASPTLSFTLGRKINPKASTFGANDGLQIEKYFGNFYAGAIGGFRPDFFDYGFNSDLLQYGGYFGIESNSEDYYGTTTVGAMEQTNAGGTDRRYIFLQHASTIAKVLNLFGSAEMDIFSNTGNGTRLTNLYLSARYRFSKAANLMVSYDSRKQIVYYETFQSEIERLLEDDLARQGIRARLNVRPAKVIWAGISYSNRFQTGEQNKSENIYGYITLTKIPVVGGRLNAAYNMNTSRYLKSNIFSVRHSRDLVENKLNAEFYYRMADYDYENQNTKYKQNYYGLALLYRISKTWQFTISGEMSQLEDENSFRFYTQLTKRFYNKKKK